MPELTLLSALLVGLLGGVHCVGMCGGIVAAMSFGGRQSGMGLHLAYNLGRIASYTVFGFFAGSLGAGALRFDDILPIQQTLYLLAQVILILLGLYLAGLSRAVLWLERAGGALWNRLQPVFARHLAVKTALQAVVAGLFWGWLPCGLVYSILVSAFAAGSGTGGAALMLAFGLGTLPNLLLMGVFATRLRRFLQDRIVRMIAGLMVAGFGVWGILRPLLAG
jgi:sulfite exporter TauE/SafE